MSYDDTPDAVFNPGDDPLPSTSELFKDLDVERGYSPPYGNPRFDRSATGGFYNGVIAQGFSFQAGGIRLPSAAVRKARVAHLPQPAHAEEEENPLPPLFSDSKDGDIAEELLTPESFEWWKTRDDLASKGLLPDIPKIYHCGVQRRQVNVLFAPNKTNVEWEDLSLGVRWIILLRLSEKQSFGIVVVSRLKLLKSQVHDFITSYINYCDQWNAFEKTVFQRSLALRGYGDTPDRLLINWLHEKRPQLPTDRLTDDDVQMGLRFLQERGVVDHNIDFQEWMNEEDTKDFAHLKIDGHIMRDCMDHRLLRRATAAKLLPIREIEETVRQHGRDNRRNEHNAHVRSVMINDAFLGTLQDVVPFEDGYWYDDMELSSEAQAILDTISADLRIGEPMPMPIPPYQRQQKREAAMRALRHMVPELQPQHVQGSLVKTQWEIDNGYPMGYYVPEEQTKDGPLHGPAVLPTIVEQPTAQASGSCIVQTPGRSTGQQSDSPAAFGAALAGGYNVSRPRIGAARARFMTSNDKGQLMVGMAADILSAAEGAPQNPGSAKQLAEQGYRDQPEMPRRAAMEAEPVNFPGLRPAVGAEPDIDALLERSKRTRRLSARARESLQYALEMGQITETIHEKPRGKKVRPSRSKRKQADEDAQFGFGSTQEAGYQGEAAVIAPPTQTGGSLAHPNDNEQTSPSQIVDEAPMTEVDLKHHLAFDESDLSGSEASTTLGTRQRPARKRINMNQRSDKFFGMYKTQELNACPPPVSTIHCAWSADMAGFAVEAVRATYALRADRINPDSLVPSNRQMDPDTVQATITSMGAEYSRIERQRRGENGPNAEKAEFAGVADSATFAIHATEASFALEEVEVMVEMDVEEGT
ncbi:hypothetical protein TARUN_5161 [Trichoderma arundinaceum]|uniref:Uncharacterized protein n=1 Tax=Trichoderma arundinaceum TaxID=490622 RepID=A0A395NML2_TRIAR|nr:hypothetical protein TARUN_5161 [Trichoderma arundinaceum]